MIRFLVIFKVAFRALRRNKMRTVLTMLGIIIGVGAVIAMVALGRGAKAQVQARIAALGQNVIQIFSGSINRSGVFTGFGGAGTLTRSIRAVKLGGRISLIGLLAGGGQIDPMPMLLKSVTLQGIFVGSRAMFEEMNRAMEINGIHPVIDRGRVGEPVGRAEQ